MLKLICSSIIVVLTLTVGAAAGPFEDGFAAYERSDFEAAHRHWLPIAEQGFAPAQYSLGMLYQDGSGIPKDDAEAAKWYRRSAEQGFPLAQYYLGLMLADGIGVERDNAQAHMWLMLAEKSGYEPAVKAVALHKLSLTIEQTNGYEMLTEAERLASEWKPTRER